MKRKKERERKKERNKKHFCQEIFFIGHAIVTLGTFAPAFLLEHYVLAAKIFKNKVSVTIRCSC